MTGPEISSIVDELRIHVLHLVAAELWKETASEWQLCHQCKEWPRSQVLGGTILWNDDLRQREQEWARCSSQQWWMGVDWSSGGVSSTKRQSRLCDKNFKQAGVVEGTERNHPPLERAVMSSEEGSLESELGVYIVVPWGWTSGNLLSQFWRPEVENQGVIKVGSFQCVWGKHLFSLLLGL